MKDDIAIYNIVIGTAGHIDHGKSTLVRTLTGIDPDRLPEEKERGMTIDLGFAPFILRDGRRAGIIDVPGHERFVKNMVAGATGIDLVMLVVAADDGIMPQTREHLNIMTLLGIERGLVVLTKIDMVEPDFVELVAEDIRGLVKGTFLDGAPIVPCSSTTGKGIEELKDLLNRMILDTPRRADGGIFRMSIQRIFSAKGFGTVVTGVPVSGRVKIGDVVEILPLDKTGRIRGLQAYKSDVEEVCAGHSSAINVADIDHTLVKRGDVVCQPGYFEPSRFIEGRFRYLPEIKRKLKNLTQVKVHTGTAEALGRIVLLDRKGMEPGEEAAIQLRLDEPLVVGSGDSYVVRLQSPAVTIGGGRILTHSPAKRRHFYRDAVPLLAECEKALDDPEALIAFALKNADPDLLDLKAAARLAKAPPADVEPIVKTLLEQGTLIAGGTGKFIHQRVLRSVQETIAARIGRFHKENPLRLGIDRTTLRGGCGLDDDLFDLALTRFVAEGAVVDENGCLRLKEFKVRLDDELTKAAAEVERILKETKFQTPRVEELYGMVKVRKEKVDHVLTLLDEMGAIVKLKEGVILHRESVGQARERLTEILKREGTMEAGKFKETLGTTRKYVIPLLEYFDETGLTVREGNVRRLR